MECGDYAVDDNPEERLDPIRKCYLAAKNHGYTVFSLAGGRCFSSISMSLTYSIFHPSTNCRDGVGGENSSDVYFILQQGKVYHDWICMFL